MRWHLRRFGLLGACLLVLLAFLGANAALQQVSRPSTALSVLIPFVPKEDRRDTGQAEPAAAEVLAGSGATDTENASIHAASGALARSPVLFPPNEPAFNDYTPVYVGEELLTRKDFPVKFLKEFAGQWTVDDPALAIFHIVCCGPLDRLLQLPPRTPERPYLCYDCDAAIGLDSLSVPKSRACTNSCLDIWALLRRRDFMFSSSDLRFWDITNDSALLLPGVTHLHHFPKPELLDKYRVRPSDPPKYFLTFQGLWNVGQRGTSFVRLNMAVMLNSTKRLPKAMKTASGDPLPLPTENYTPASDVFISISGEEHNYKERKPYYSLFDSSYSLVLHGHGRWSYRLAEVLSGGSIPVVMAEGWNLPYSEARVVTDGWLPYVDLHIRPAHASERIMTDVFAGRCHVPSAALTAEQQAFLVTYQANRAGSL
ncbi:Ext1 [Symbiodinium natans]|uniref:Ext1 protein n=1 Tax=Symbiodinium natans TaxID=878477 RepID=A0A812GCD8_9DINO|nr:Ext1 [Symbiodinium natans]